MNIEKQIKEQIRVAIEYNEPLSSVRSELSYVDKKEKEDPESHIVENFPLGSALSAIRLNLDRAQEAWYHETQPNHDKSMEYLRKIAAICIKMGAKYGMPKRENNE